MTNKLLDITKEGVEVNIHLIPGAKKEQILGIVETIRGHAIKIAIHEKPSENKANEALVKFLASLLSIPKSKIEIKRGHKSRDKRIAITGVTVAEISAKIAVIEI